MHCCFNCDTPITRQAHFYPYVMFALDQRPEDLVPVFCGVACMLGFVAKEKKIPVQQVARDYVRYEKVMRETAK